jgi:hypothetical protein
MRKPCVRARAQKTSVTKTGPSLARCAATVAASAERASVWRRSTPASRTAKREPAGLRGSKWVSKAALLS